jgi:actin-related protein
VGDECFSNDVKEQVQSGGVSVLSLFEDGRIRSWNCLQLWLSRVFSDIGEFPFDRRVLIVVSLRMSKVDWEFLTQMFFEEFEVLSLAISHGDPLVLFANSHTSGTIVDFGYSSVRIVPVFEGSIQHAAVQYHPFAAQALLEELAKIHAHDIPSLKELDLLLPHEMEEKYLKNYSLTAQPQVTDCWWQSDHQLSMSIALPKLIQLSLSCCERERRETLQSCVMLVGGLVPLGHLAERLEKELAAIFPEGAAPKLVKPDNCDAFWSAAAVLSALPKELRSLSITRQDYHERGPPSIHGK